MCVFVLCSRATLFTSGNCDVFLLDFDVCFDAYFSAVNLLKAFLSISGCCLSLPTFPACCVCVVWEGGGYVRPPLWGCGFVLHSAMAK